MMVVMMVLVMMMMMMMMMMMVVVVGMIATTMRSTTTIMIMMTLINNTTVRRGILTVNPPDVSTRYVFPFTRMSTVFGAVPPSLPMTTANWVKVGSLLSHTSASV